MLKGQILENLVSRFAYSKKFHAWLFQNHILITKVIHSIKIKQYQICRGEIKVLFQLPLIQITPLRGNHFKSLGRMYLHTNTHKRACTHAHMHTHTHTHIYVCVYKEDKFFPTSTIHFIQWFAFFTNPYDRDPFPYQHLAPPSFFPKIA